MPICLIVFVEVGVAEMVAELTADQDACLFEAFVEETEAFEHTD